MSFTLIVAVDNQGGFGKDGEIPWYFSEDFKQFKEKTLNKVCVMGRHTYTDMADIAKKKGRDITNGILPGRTSYVVSNTKPDDFFVGAKRVPELGTVRELHENQEIIVLGGEKLFIQALSTADTIHMTVIDHNYKCDRFFPVEVAYDGFKIVDGKKITDKDKNDNDAERTLMFVTYKLAHK